MALSYDRVQPNGNRCESDANRAAVYARAASSFPIAAVSAASPPPAARPTERASSSTNMR